MNKAFAIGSTIILAAALTACGPTTSDPVNEDVAEETAPETGEAAEQDVPTQDDPAQAESDTAPAAGDLDDDVDRGNRIDTITSEAE